MMNQLSLFEKPKPSLPDFEYLSYIAGRLQIRVVKKDKKDVVPLFLRCMCRIKPMIDEWILAAKNGFMEPSVPVDYHLFFIENEKAASHLQARNG